MNSIKRFFGAVVIMSGAIAVVSCGGDTIPKPKAYLRLDYNQAKYVLFDEACPYTFGVNSIAKITDKGNCNFTIQYPKMKATVYLSYKPVHPGNLDSLLRDAQHLIYKHVIKADAIQEQPYSNAGKDVYGMFYNVGGDAATNAQFYVTDNKKHFLTGSLYFYVKPNYDSIMPAASYIKDDMRNIMETIKWK
jgi:gliding motility-associated lipoprotein GldD